MITPYAGIVLCGGRSSRMGYPKALLPFGPELMVQRVVRIASEIVSWNSRSIACATAPAISTTLSSAPPASS